MNEKIRVAVTRLETAAQRYAEATCALEAANHRFADARQALYDVLEVETGTRP